jgi:hypothetical protein
MTRWFGDIDDYPPTAFLLARGWTEHAGMWTKPTPAHTPSTAEVECLTFLRDEWDYDPAPSRSPRDPTHPARLR